MAYEQHAARSKSAIEQAAMGAIIAWYAYRPAPRGSELERAAARAVPRVLIAQMRLRQAPARQRSRRD
jgi:hypothetical protein